MNTPSYIFAGVIFLGSGLGTLWVIYHIVVSSTSVLSGDLLIFLIITYGYIFWNRRYIFVSPGDDPFLVGRQLAFLVFPSFANLVLMASWYFFRSWSKSVLIGLISGYLIGKLLQRTIFAHEYIYRDRR